MAILLLVGLSLMSHGEPNSGVYVSVLQSHDCVRLSVETLWSRPLENPEIEENTACKQSYCIIYVLNYKNVFNITISLCCNV